MTNPIPVIIQYTGHDGLTCKLIVPGPEGFDLAYLMLRGDISWNVGVAELVKLFEKFLDNQTISVIEKQLLDAAGCLNVFLGGIL